MSYKLLGYAVRCIYSEDEKYNLKYYSASKEKGYTLTANSSNNAKVFKSYADADKIWRKAQKAFNGKAHFGIVAIMDDFELANAIEHRKKKEKVV